MADTTGTDDTTAVEIGTDTARVVRPSGDDTGSLPHHSFLSRLYTGTGAFEVIGRRRLWYGISGVIVGIAIATIASLMPYQSRRRPMTSNAPVPV